MTLVALATDNGLKLTTIGDKLNVTGPKTLANARIVEQLAASKLAVLEVLTNVLPAPRPEIIHAGLSWRDAERLHAELKATVPGQTLYGIGADPAQLGKYRIVKRDYMHGNNYK